MISAPLRAHAALVALLGPGNYLRLATTTGYDVRYVSRILRGLLEGSWRARVAIAQAAGVTLDELEAYIHSEERA